MSYFQSVHRKLLNTIKGIKNIVVFFLFWVCTCKAVISCHGQGEKTSQTLWKNFFPTYLLKGTSTVFGSTHFGRDLKSYSHLAQVYESETEVMLLLLSHAASGILLTGSYYCTLLTCIHQFQPPWLVYFSYFHFHFISLYPVSAFRSRSSDMQFLPFTTSEVSCLFSWCHHPWGIQLQSLGFALMQDSTAPVRSVLFIFTRLKILSVKQHITDLSVLLYGCLWKLLTAAQFRSSLCQHRRWLCFYLLVLIEAMFWDHQKENYHWNNF